MKLFKRAFMGVLSTITAISAVMSFGMTASAEVTANPVISRGCPAYSGTSQSTAYAACDAHYYSSWYGTAPDYLAYDLSAVPDNEKKQVIAVWYNNTANYDYTIGNYGGSSSSMPTDYTIEINAAEGGSYPTDGWVVVDTVEDNTLHSRQHLVDMEGYNWIRMNITGADGKESGSVGINMDVHNVSDGVSDSWIFFGDSITAGGMMNCYGTGFAELVNAIDSNYFPIQENGGIGGILSSHGKENIDRWLESYPGKYVSIAYGTNDSWGNQTGAQGYYENTVYMVEAVLAKGMIPVVPKIPYATEPGVNTYLDDYNAMIDKLYEEYPQVVKGPDFDALFRENPSLLSGDGVHPSSEGYAAMRELWAETMYASVYSTGGEDIVPQPLKGDINNDGSINVADAVLLRSFILGKFDGTEFFDSTLADINEDNTLDVFDVIAMRKLLISLQTQLASVPAASTSVAGYSKSN